MWKNGLAEPLSCDTRTKSTAEAASTWMNYQAARCLALSNWEGGSLQIGRAVFVDEPAISVGAHHVDVRAGREVAWVSGTNLQIDRYGRGLVGQMMAIARSLWKSRAVSCAQQGLTVVFYEFQLTLKDVHEFVFMGVPMPLAGPGARWQGHQIDAEIMKSACVAKPAARASGAWKVERSRVARTSARRNRGYVNFWHVEDLL